MELVDKNLKTAIKRFIITLEYIKKNMNIMRKETEDVKDPNETFFF